MKWNISIYFIILICILCTHVVKEQEIIMFKHYEIYFYEQQSMKI